MLWNYNVFYQIINIEFVEHFGYSLFDILFGPSDFINIDKVISLILYKYFKIYFNCLKSIVNQNRVEG